eukprot:TRINITY_DN3104_c0_g1_i8.p1 TRINITY_DN3104_c0_g1~~TRINITY_DN3104_c0_g1_i8.p1  ORF type:complete len:152 (-),score=23.64 TRINITY_DN3104_c0_g1_i8:721-1176(-)
MDEFQDDELWIYCPWCGSLYDSDDVKCKSCETQRLRSKKLVPKEPWGKELWKRHPYPDNYFDEALFLQGLKRNINVVEYEYWGVVVDSTAILGQLTAVALYAAIFILTYTGQLSLLFLFALAFFFLVMGFALQVTIEGDAWTRWFPCVPST